MRFLRVLIGEGRLLWLTVGAIAALLVIPGLWTCSGEARLRYAAMFLQLLGIVVVAIGIRDSRNLFARPSLWDHAAEWVRHLRTSLRLPPKHVSASTTISIEGLATARSSASAILRSAPRTVEERLDAMTDDINQLRQQVNVRHEVLESQVKETIDRIERETKERRQGDSQVRNLLEAEAVGSIHLEVIGLAWILVGTVVGSLTSELAPLVAHLPCV